MQGDVPLAMSELMRLTAGTHFVGDPSYALTSREYAELSKQEKRRGYPESGAYKVLGREVAVITTGSDGWYEDTDGYTYAVDSAALGVVKLSARQVHHEGKRLTTLGRIVHFEAAFECSTAATLLAVGTSPPERSL